MCPHYCESLDPKDFVSSADPVMDESHSEAFEAKARQRNSIATDPKNPARATLVVGDDDWPFPVPLVKKSGKWLFDSKAQREEILYRRIGANELDAIQVCRGYVEAQKKYSLDIHDNAGVNHGALQSGRVMAVNRRPVACQCLRLKWLWTCEAVS